MRRLEELQSIPASSFRTSKTLLHFFNLLSLQHGTQGILICLNLCFVLLLTFALVPFKINDLSASPK